DPSGVDGEVETCFRPDHFDVFSSGFAGSGARKKSSSQTVPLKAPLPRSGKLNPYRFPGGSASSTNRTHRHFFSAGGQEQALKNPPFPSGRTRPLERNVSGTALPSRAKSSVRTQNRRRYRAPAFSVLPSIRV